MFLPMTGTMRTYWDVDHKLLAEEYFTFLGQKEGLYRMYHHNGRVARITYYVHGNRQGEHIEYLDCGQLYEHSIYDGNTRVKVLFDRHCRV